MEDAAVQAPSSLRRWAVAGFVAALVVVASLGLWAADLRSDTGLPLGAHDFIQHSAAFDLAIDGGDPYDNATLAAAENRLFERYDAGAQRFWYPPWILVLLAPVVALPFELATASWMVLTVVGAVGVIVVSWRLHTRGRLPIPPVVLGLSVLFVPLLECLLLGQMGVAIALITLGGLLALKRGHETAAGVLLALTMMRPQVVVVPLIVVGIHVVATGRWQVVRAAVATAAGVVIASLVAFPDVWRGWDPIGGSPTHFLTPTIATWVRTAVADGGSSPTWPLTVVPLVAVVAVVPWAIRRRDAVPWHVMPALLGVSVLMSPYAWVYDSMLLMPMHVALVAGITSERLSDRAFALGAIGLQLAGLFVRSLPSTGHEHQILVPAGLLLLYVAWTRTAAGSMKLDPEASSRSAADVAV